MSLDVPQSYLQASMGPPSGPCTLSERHARRPCGTNHFMLPGPGAKSRCRRKPRRLLLHLEPNELERRDGVLGGGMTGMTICRATKESGRQSGPR